MNKDNIIKMVFIIIALFTNININAISYKETNYNADKGTFYNIRIKIENYNITMYYIVDADSVICTTEKFKLENVLYPSDFIHEEDYINYEYNVLNSDYNKYKYTSHEYNTAYNRAKEYVNDGNSFSITNFIRQYIITNRFALIMTK